ncbi:hypothetical protein LAA83_000611 [Salmonella enterica subsp. enterica serovar Takoradi]|nr:hypothetical protein [Salmonella enterica]EBX7377461.1 hypothetical protein [Salmonella enterica subsp. enterica serovar Takoradi]ECD8160958.1 hypothetical protein [Salmonella enterica subsp. enterica serovar Takoradi]EHF1134846.1 hypothetical protein [Salmonella enterica subsp. enterica serovar Takoradi]EIC3970842.1 hypothetical protein [Salmonella enterica subsp. enterica serovar Takoradi]
MLNRQVRQIHPQEDKDSQTKTFGDYSESPNIVLLGDPSAGKTHLFKQFSAFQRANYLTVRHFLSGVPIDNQKALFIDALDEKRSSHNSSDVIDDIVRRLFSQTPQKVRISCRSQDWLGESDLSAFLPYFERTGGYVVLHLQQLSREEQIAILHAHGIEHPEKFLEEAEKHSAYEFLHNPQNLLMLAEAVKEGNWPQTRSELFHSATQLLLTEHSKEHSRQNSGIYTSDELEPPAGSICALRILSDVSGISLLPNDIRSEYPSYRTIPFFSHEIIRATLSRRVFSAGDEPETVDYSHRTIAEYLAAKWLASIVEKGLPLGRLRSLLGFEGYPSSELRGLHAWLAVFLPQYANVFIQADPYGVLTYGDTASLSTVDKQSLLVALSKLSESDPWFRNHGFSSNLNGFVSEEMEAHLRLIIHDPKSRFSLRMLILESLSVTTPILSLNQDLIDVVKSECHSYAEKEEAITALIHSGLSGIKEVVGIYPELKEINHNNIRLRNHIIQLLYKDYFSALDVAQLLIDTLSVTEERLPVGSLWGIIDVVPVEGIITIFKCLYQYQNENIDNQYSSSINRHEVLYYIESGLVIILNTKDQYTAEQIWICLSVYYWYKEHYSRFDSKTEQIVQLLKEREWQYEDIIDAAVASFSRYSTRFLFLHEFEQSTFWVIPRELLLSRFIHYLSSDEKTPDKIKFIYRLAFPILWSCDVPSQKVFDFLISYGLFNNELSTILEDALICEIEDWQVKNNVSRLESEKEKRDIVKADKLDFELHREQIVLGLHKGWLKHIAHIYYALYSDVDDKQSYLERLSSLLGDENVTDSISGLIAVLERQDLPTFDEISVSIVEGHYYEWWYSILAGAEELWKCKPDISQWSERLLKLLLALDIELGTHIQRGKRNETHPFDCKKHIITYRTDVFIETYRYITDVCFKNKQQYIKALNYLLNEDSLPGSYVIPLIMYFAKKYPDDINHTQSLVEWLLARPQIHGELLELSQLMVNRRGVLKKVNYHIWLVCCYLLEPEQAYDLFVYEAKSDPEIIWIVRELRGNARRRRENNNQELTLIQLETIIKVSATHFPNAYHPIDGSHGSKNSWDYAEFIRALINEVSSISSYDASEVLERLLLLPECESYRDHLLHAQSNQRIRYRESQFHHADWKQAVRTLVNETPVNVMDLYSLLLDHIRDISNRIAYENTDIYKQFWNEDRYGRPQTPKPEESCRNIFLDLLRARLDPLRISCEPEGHMVSDKRADIIVLLPGIKIPIEIKRDYHRDVWTALNGQLDKLYTINPDAAGYGIYLVFWFGSARPNALPRLTKIMPQPKNASAMENMLNETVPVEKRDRLSAIVIDVSGEVILPVEASNSAI